MGDAQPSVAFRRCDRVISFAHHAGLSLIYRIIFDPLLVPGNPPVRHLRPDSRPRISPAVTSKHRLYIMAELGLAVFATLDLCFRLDLDFLAVEQNAD